MLGLEDRSEATPEAIKKAYRKMALKWHPDKHAHADDGGAAAEEEFKLVQEAYETLSDANEKAWYDAHRQQILSGADMDSEDAGGYGEEVLPSLWKYFSSSAFLGFGDDKGGFYKTFAAVFEKIDMVEANAAEEFNSLHGAKQRIHFRSAPSFGCSNLVHYSGSRFLSPL